MEMYAKEIGRMSADPNGAPAIVPKGFDSAGAGRPPVQQQIMLSRVVSNSGYFLAEISVSSP